MLKLIKTPTKQDDARPGQTKQDKVAPRHEGVRRASIHSKDAILRV